MPLNPHSRPLDIEFAEFHRQNPHVYDTLVRLAKEAKAKGHKVVGIKMLWEIVRWENFLRTSFGVAPVKLNNNLTSRYARLLMAQNPGLNGFFKLRRLG